MAIKKCIGMAVIIGLVLSMPLWAADTQDELKKIYSKIEQNKSLIKEKKNEKKQAERALGQISKELKTTELHLRKTQQNLQVTQQKVQQTESRLGETQRQYQTKSQYFAKRIVDIYKNKNLGALEFIFAPKDFMSILDSSYFFERIMNTDMSLIKDIRGKYGDLQVQKKQLKAVTKTLSQIKNEIEDKEAVLEQKKKEQHQYVQSLQAQISEMDRQNKDLERASQEISSRILRMSKGTSFLGTGRFVRPATGFFSSPFGWRKHPIFKRRIFHNGLDFASKYGEPIVAADSGVVIVAGEQAQYHGYGKITIIDHGVKGGKRLSTVYAHQSRIIVSEGQSVKQGETIGYVGSTGYSTGPHLHFEVRVDGSPVNPMNYLR